MSYTYSKYFWVKAHYFSYLISTERFLNGRKNQILKWLKLKSLLGIKEKAIRKL